MAAQSGQAIVVSFKDDAGSPAYQVVAGLRSRRIAFNAEMVDVTCAESTGMWREVLDAAGVRTASISGDGVFTDDAGMEAVRDAFFENELRDAKIFITGFGTFEGKFKVTALELGGEHNQQVTTSLTFESAGAITFVSA
jgi:TP901-1 family phage major tail protein